MNTDYFTKLTRGKIFGQFPKKIRGFWNDSRTIHPGDCFLALKAQRDGHEFLQNAQENGASCAIVSQINSQITLPQLCVEDVFKAAKLLVKNHRKNYKIISITGSYGKTSTKDWLKLLLDNQAYATPQNLNNELGIVLSLSHLDQEPIGIIEAGIDHPGEMAPIIDLLCPDTVVFTGITPVHVANFKNYQQLIDEKFKIIAYAIENKCPCLFPESCLKHALFRDIAPRCIIIGQSPKVKNNLKYTHYSIFERTHSFVKILLNGTFFKNVTFTLPIMSDGQIENFVKAAIIAKIEGVPDESLQERILNWKPSSMRGETIIYQGHEVYLDCYNANPVAMFDALNFFDTKYSGKKVYVLGGMKELGTFSETYHKTLANYFVKKEQIYLFAVGKELIFFYNFLKNKVSQQDFFIYHSYTVEGIKNVFDEAIQGFGAIFIKGSHGYRLWELVADEKVTNK